MSSPNLIRSAKIGEATGGVGKDRLAKRYMKTLKEQAKSDDGFAQMNLLLIQTIERKEFVSEKKNTSLCIGFGKHNTACP